ncbi:hypothetical protein D3C86_1972150 [compost metagenome]
MVFCTARVAWVLGRRKELLRTTLRPSSGLTILETANRVSFMRSNSPEAMA